MKQSWKTVILWLLLILLFVSVYELFSPAGRDVTEIDFSEYLGQIHASKAKSEPLVKEVTIQGFDHRGEFTDGRKFHTYGIVTEEMVKTMVDAGSVVKFKEEGEKALWQQLLISWLPMLILFGLFFFFMRQLQGGGGKAMNFGRSKARMITPDQHKATFQDVAGVDEAKEELKEIIEFLKAPKRFIKLGGRIPKGVLLVGPPGTGKTLLAKAVAGEAGVPFFSISGSDFVEMFVGVGAARVRDMFGQAKTHAPCIVFIDELDAVGRHRGAGLGGGHDEREQTLNQLLVEMDGFEVNEGVILVAATNRPDVLDPALLRPGRFDRQVVVPKPDVRGRLQILQVHAGKRTLAEGVDLELIARGTPGFSGADLENLINEAALLAARSGKERIETAELEAAKDKILMGTERRSMIISDEEKEVIAYHEAGHALVAWLLPDADPIHKVTIIPRGMALGVTQQLPEEDKYIIGKPRLLAIVKVLLAGRASEMHRFNIASTGAANDLERATSIAHRMVCEWGMSETLGPRTFGKVQEHIFLGKEIARERDFSEQTAQEIDREVNRIIRECEQAVAGLIGENREALERIAVGLLAHETLGKEQLERIIAGDRTEAGAAESAGGDGHAFAAGEV